MKSFFRLSALTLAASVLLSGAALAQGGKPAAPATPAPGAPTTPTDIKPIGDWTVRCFPVASTSPCDMYEEMDDKSSHQRVLGFSLAYVPSADKHAAQIAVPLGVSIPKGLVIQTDNFTSPVYPYRRCDQQGCYVELILPNDAVESLSHSGPQAAIKIVADNGKTFDLRFSLNGFAAAHDAMANLARQKAKGEASAPAAAPAPAPAP